MGVLVACFFWALVWRQEQSSPTSEKQKKTEKEHYVYFQMKFSCLFHLNILEPLLGSRKTEPKWYSKYLLSSEV